MLVENNFTNKIVVLKLTTGEEVIARSRNYNSDGSIEIKNPLSMVMVPNEEGNQGMVAFAPWMLALDDDQIVTIGKQNYLCLFTARADAADQYKRAIGEPEELMTHVSKAADPISVVSQKGGRGR
jgi:hypothetical protein